MPKAMNFGIYELEKYINVKQKITQALTNSKSSHLMKKTSLNLVLLLTVIMTYGGISNSPARLLSNADSLVAFYPFNGNANDESGNGSDPTYIGSGVTLTSDRFGNPDKAYSFDGEAGSYIRMPADKFPTTDRTISFWFNADKIENHPTPLSYGGDACHNSVLMIINKGDYPNAYTVLSHCGSNFISAPYSEDPVNKWYYLTMTIKGSIQKIFINGELQQTANTFNTPTVVVGKSAILGAILFTDGVNVYNEPTAGNFKGKMDDFRFYNVAFTDTEVLNLFNNEASGIVAYYPFNGNANDESGNGHDGSVSGATSTTDRFNQPDKAYNFVYNGFSSDKIQVSGTSELNFSSGGFSLSAWVKFSGLANGGYNYPIFSKHICGEQSGYILMLYNGKLTFWLAGSGAYNVVGTPDDYTDNSWHQVVAVYDGTTQYIYVDGVLKNSMPFIYNTFNSANWALGGYNGCNGGFNGKVDEIKVFNQALSGAEILDMYTKSSNDLVAYFPFNGNANDESGNGNDGINHSGIYSTDRFEKPNASVLFTGNDSYVEGTNPGTTLPTGNSPRTITAWIKENSFHPWGNNIFHYGLDQSAPTNFHLYTTDVIRFGNGYDYGVVAGTTPVVDSRWHFVAGVYEGGTEHIAKVYVDGKLDGSGSLSSEPNTTLGSNWKIGRFMTGSNNFDGEIDEVKIYNRALSGTEIEKEFNLTRNSLVAYYPFSGNSNDASGNGNNGTITGLLVTQTADRYGEEGKAFKFWFPDYISVPTKSSFFTDEFTTSYWYKVASYWGDRGVLSCVGNSGGYQQVFSAGTTFTYLLGYNFPTSSWFWTNYTVPNSPNTWQHITTTYKKTGDNASVSRLFINGELKTTDTYANSIAYPGSEIFYIGRNHSDLGLNGELDEVRFYNKALSDQEIKNLYLAEAKPVLQQPANQSSVNSPTPEMRWISPQENAEFIFQLAADSLFGTILYEELTSAFSTQLPATLINGWQNFYWRVCSKSNEVKGPWSEVWSFNIINTGLDKPTGYDAALRIYPSPANEKVKITYALPGTITRGSPETIEIVNSLGKCIKTLAKKNTQSGINEIETETGSLPSGMYYCRLKAGNVSGISKFVIIH